LSGQIFDTETLRFRERQTANGFATEIAENGNDNGGKDVYGNGNGQRPTARTQRTVNSNVDGNGIFFTTESTEGTEINDNGSSE
jgi:hypothetical protein